MFRAIYQNYHIICWIFALSLVLSLLIYSFIGIRTKKYGISLKILLIAEEYIFAAISSIIIFMIFSFPVALAVWFLLYFLMNFIFRNHRRIISCIIYCEQNMTALTSQQMKLFLQLNPCVKSSNIASWTKEFCRLRKEVLYKLDNNIYVKHLNFKCKMLPFSILASGMIGIWMALLTYGNLVENGNSFLLLLLENYAILSGVLLALYVLLYLSLVGNVLHYMWGQKRLFKIIFAIFSIIMYIGVTVISMNNG